ncbi:MAG: 1,6-anhydro-N-acetylmuramyl-L-alanine amidase AmpD [Proteobacteria bacterium]|nr:1,6-anhydro-N-acetylmuramyl-L-alanine amidase AmpD [Pseudomonadota bacterium]
MEIREAPSQFCDERATGSVVDTVVIHSMWTPDAAIPDSPEACIACLAQHEVSAHYIIARDGQIWRLVPEQQRAWHAGVSRLHDGREEVNHYSIGVELLGKERTKFAAVQYERLVELTADMVRRLPLTFMVGHDDIAQPPGRKKDPGPLFDWEKLRDLVDADPMTAHITFPFRKLG